MFQRLLTPQMASKYGPSNNSKVKELICDLIDGEVSRIAKLKHRGRFITLNTSFRTTYVTDALKLVLVIYTLLYFVRAA